MANNIEVKKQLQQCINIDTVNIQYINKCIEKLPRHENTKYVKSKAEACMLILTKNLKELFGISYADDEVFESPYFMNYSEIKLIAFTEEERQQIHVEYKECTKNWEDYNGFGQYTCCYIVHDISKPIRAKVCNNKYCIEVDENKWIELNIIDLYELIYKITYIQAIRDLCNIFNIQILYISEQQRVCTRNLEIIENANKIENLYPTLFKLLLSKHIDKLVATHRIYLEKIWYSNENGVFISHEEIGKTAGKDRRTVQTIIKAFLAVQLLKLEHIDENANKRYYYYAMQEYTDEKLQEIEAICKEASIQIKYLRRQNKDKRNNYNLSKLTKETCEEIFTKEVANSIFA